MKRTPQSIDWLEKYIELGLFGLACAAMTLSSAVKLLLGEGSIVWLDPTLILAIVILGLYLASGRKIQISRRIATYFWAAFLCTVISTISGVLIQYPFSTYEVLRIPGRIVLLFVWMAISCNIIQKFPGFVAKVIALTVIGEFIVSIVFVLMGGNIIPSSGSIGLYLKLYALRQVIWVGSMPIPRLGGTFMESPPYGLFMLTMLISMICLKSYIPRSKLVAIAMAMAALGIIGSLSDQVFLGAIVALLFGMAAIWRRSKIMTVSLILLVFVPVAIYSVLTVNNKAAEITSGSGDSNISGSSGGERMFHVRYAISLLKSHPAALLFGIGPGRYGQYVAETGVYPNTTTIQSSFIEILTEWGVIGAAVSLGILVFFGYDLYQKRGNRYLGFFIALLLGSAFQEWLVVYLAFALMVLAGSALMCEGQNFSQENGRDLKPQLGL